MQEHPASVAVGTHPKVCLLAHPTARPVPVRGLRRRSSALGGPLEGWLVASKRLGPLPRMRWAALSRGCSREGSEWGAAAAEGSEWGAAAAEGAQARRAKA